jgi:AraC-like DNA-binding protein
VHTLYEIIFVYNGSGSFVIEDEVYDVAENTIFLIPPGKWHIMHVPKNAAYDRVVLYFPKSLIPIPVNKNSPVHFLVDEKVRELFLKLETYSEKYPPESFYALLCAFITELFITVIYDSAYENIEKDYDKNAMPNLVKNAIRYINDNITADLGAQSIADAMFVSRTHLCHVFSETMKTGLMHYVSAKKMYKARSMLKKGVSSKEVCEILGYKSYPTFWRNYKATFGKLPSEERWEQ